MRLVIDLNDEVYSNMVIKNEYTDRDIIAVHNALMGAIRITEGHGEADVVDRVLEIIDDVKNRATAGDMDAYEVYTEIWFGVLALKGEQE